jgi:Kef-type K+ transport system membrane component KefB
MIDFIQASAFNQLAALLILAGALGAAAMKLKQPLIVAFICVGILAGPDFLDIVGPHETLVSVLADLGVALLLFMVGLQLDLGLLRALGPVAGIAGSIQIAATALLGSGLAALCGLPWMDALFCGVALAFSSTVIVVRLLTDRRAIDSLHGRIALGILIVQDLAVILAIVALAGAGRHGDETLIGLASKIALLAAATALFILYAAKPLTRRLGASQEMLMICALAFATSAAGLCHALGLGRELGGLLAGVALASTPARGVIAARLAPLRDFLLLFFFVSLGAQMNPMRLGGELGAGLALSAFVLAGKPLIILLAVAALGYRKRTSFMTAVTLGQVSEFSLVFTAMGVDAGLVRQDTLETVTFVTLVTIGLSAYAVAYSGSLFYLLDRHFGIYERRLARRGREGRSPDDLLKKPCDILVFGLGRYGVAMAQSFLRNGHSVLGIDFDPHAIARAASAGVPAYYGDATDADFPEHLPLAHVKAAVFAFQHHLSSPLDPDFRESLARALRAAGFRGRIVTTAHFREGAGKLRGHGIDAVLCPFEDAATYGADYVLAMLAEPGLQPPPPDGGGGHRPALNA